MNRNKATNQAHGKYGHDLITDTSLHSGNWGSIYALEEVVVTVLTVANSTGSYSTLTLKAFTQIFGDISAIQIASGKLIAYKDEL